MVGNLPFDELGQERELCGVPVGQRELESTSLHQLFEQGHNDLWVLLLERTVERLLVFKVLEVLFVLLQLLPLAFHALDEVVHVRHYRVLASVEVLVVLSRTLEIWREGSHDHFHLIVLLLLEFIKVLTSYYEASIHETNDTMVPVS